MSKSRWFMAAFLISVCCLLTLAARPAQADQDADALTHEFQTAVQHFNSGQYRKAVRGLESMARQVPSSFEVHELLGLAYAAESKYQEANPHFEKAVLLKPNYAAARANLAVNLARLGKKHEAEVQFKKAVAISPGDYEANHDFGEFCVQGGKIAEAIPYLENAQRAKPDSYGNGYDLALAYEKTGQFAAARRELQALLKQKDAAEFHNLLGEVEEKSGNYVAAANEYQRAVQMDPTESNFFDWGSEFLLHHTWNAAVVVFSKGVQRYPNSAPLAVGLGMAYYWHGVKVLVRATDLAPEDPHTYYFLSKAYKHAPGQASEVIARFRRFEELRPLDPQAAYYYAMGLWKGKEMENSGADLAQVESLLKKAVQLDPSYADAHLQLGNLYSQERQYAMAVPEYQRALHLNSNLSDAYYRLGQAYVHLGKMDLAQKEFAVHQKLYTRHLAEDDQQRQQIRQFVYSVQGGSQAAPSPQQGGVAAGQKHGTAAR
ncbi:MAG: tetratricopeptide repeat protein [Acidobacteriota bacterium]